ncbi:MAG: capsid protein, partial [Rouxiella badensis]
MTTTTSNASSLDGYLGHFEEMKSVHTQEMLKLNDIGQALARCKKDLEATQEKSKEDETSWRSRFRSLRGEITNDMKQEHTQRIVQRELAQEYSALIDEMELDQQFAMLS